MRAKRRNNNFQRTYLFLDKNGTSNLNITFSIYFATMRIKIQKMKFFLFEIHEISAFFSNIN